MSVSYKIEVYDRSKGKKKRSQNQIIYMKSLRTFSVTCVIKC